jgi:hypothetical protein
MKCPACDSPLQRLPYDGFADKYRCERDGEFRISDTAEARGFWTMPKAVRASALQHARNTARGRDPFIATF